MKAISKKGQMGGLENAPTIVMIVGLVFLTIATMALIGQKYGTSVLTDTSGSVTNETGWLNGTTYTLDKATALGFTGPAIVTILNTSDGAALTDYSLIGNILYNTTAAAEDDVKISYTYSYDIESVAYNTTGDLQTEISNNTSIAGIVLTISLIGIVLTILIGVFMGVGRSANRV